MPLHNVSSTDHVRISVPGGRAVTLPCSLILDLHDAQKERDRRDEEEANTRMDRVMTARKAIVAHAGPWKKGEAASGRCACPVCKSPGETLAYRRAAVNGHVHARCGTPDCVSWME